MESFNMERGRGTLQKNHDHSSREIDSLNKDASFTTTQKKKSPREHRFVCPYYIHPLQVPRQAVDALMCRRVT